MGALTIISNIYGNPAVSIPAGLVDGLPVGMQVLARHHDDELLFDVALAAERTAPWPLVAPDSPADRHTPASPSSDVRVTGDFAEREVAVGAGFLREAEHPFADDVALDLVGAAGDRLGRHRHEHLGDHSVAQGVGAR